MAPTKASGKGRSKDGRKKTWTREMKTAMHIVWTEHNVCESTRANAFKLMFAAEVEQWDVTIDRLRYLMKTQMIERNQQRQKIWIEICSDVATADELARRESSRAAIRAALSSLREPRPTSRIIAAATTTLPGISRGRNAVVATGQIRKRSLHGTIYAMRNATGAPTNSVQSQPTTIPLSRRDPIAMWPGLDSDDSLGEVPPEPSPRRPRLGSARIDSPSDIPILVPRQSRQEVSKGLKPTPKTPCTPKKLDSQSVTLPFVQVHGTKLNLTPEKIARTKAALLPIQEGAAHPPLAGLLFRYWPKSTNSGLHNSEKGFTARKFFNRVKFNQQPPHCTLLDWTDLYYHIDRIGIRLGFQSPYVSTSNSLIWTIRLALKELEEDPKTRGMISVIATEELNHRSVFHVLPYHRELRKSFQFTEGSWKYAGTHEFIVWKEIPTKAVIHTFSVEDFLQFVNRDELLRKALALDTVVRSWDLKSRIIPELARRHIAFSPELVKRLAKLSGLIMGIGADATIEQLSHFVSELVQGWGFHIVRQSPAEWSRLGSVFAGKLLEYSSRGLNLRDEVKIKRAFLDGVSWGSSAHFNARHSLKTMRATWKQAGSIGLEDPGKLLHDELSGAQMALMMFEKKQQRMLPGRKTKLLIGSPSDDEGFASADYSDAEVEVAMPRASRASRHREQLSDSVEDEEEDDDDDDEGILFEMDDEGRVV